MHVNCKTNKMNRKTRRSSSCMKQKNTKNKKRFSLKKKKYHGGISEYKKKYTIMPSPLLYNTMFNKSNHTKHNISNLFYLVDTNENVDFTKNMNDVDSLLALTLTGLKKDKFEQPVKYKNENIEIV